MSRAPFTSASAFAFSASAGVGATPPKKVLALGAKEVARGAWWLDPILATLFIVLPIFCAAAYLNQFNFSDFNASENFLTPTTFALALFSMALLVLGIAIGRALQPRRELVTLIEVDRAERVLVTLGWITIIAYALLFGTLATQASLVLNLLRGDASAGSDLRDALSRIPGVTSFIQFGAVYLALLSSLVVMSGYRPPTRLWLMTGVIVVLTFLRALLASERLALLEAGAALFIVPIAYRWRPSLWRGFAPLIGIGVIFAAFAAGEYFRSWQYYRSFYDSYFDFISQRFFGYFSTSINNGAGTYLVFAQYGTKPEITSTWITKFPILGGIIRPGTEPSTLDMFLANYATPEFNNRGGFYAAYLDYPFVLASAFMLVIGIVIGWVYKNFQNKSVIGLLLYPMIFLGQTDFIRLVYIADQRTLPIFLGAFLARHWLRPVAAPRDRTLAVISASRSI